MKRILILTAGFGDGHNAAARSLGEAVAIVDPKAKAEVVDLFEAYGRFNGFLKQAYQGMVRYAPMLWSGVFSLFDNSGLFRRQMNMMGKLRNELAKRLETFDPDVVVSTYPVYSHLIEGLVLSGSSRRFRLITVVTDSISVCSAWYSAPSDLFVVANEATAAVLRESGIPARQIIPLGFPVSPQFAAARPLPLDPPENGRPAKVLYVINTGKVLAGKVLKRLLDECPVELTVTAGRDRARRMHLIRSLAKYGGRVRVHGWTDQMPQFLMTHHLLIGKAGGAMVQEALAAGCPMIINQVIPGQEEGNAELIEQLGAGAVARRVGEVPDLVARALANGFSELRQWRMNLKQSSRPDSALRIAELVLGNCHYAGHGLDTKQLVSGRSHEIVGRLTQGCNVGSP